MKQSPKISFQSKYYVRNLEIRAHVRDGVFFHYRSGATLVAPDNNPPGGRKMKQSPKISFQLKYCVINLKFRAHVRNGVYFHYRSSATLVTPQNNPLGVKNPPKGVFTQNIALFLYQRLILQYFGQKMILGTFHPQGCLLYTSPSPRDRTRSRMPSSA